MMTSTERSRVAESRLPLTSSLRLRSLSLEKLSANVPSNESAWTVLMALMDSAAVAAMAPSCRRCFLATSRMRPVRVFVRSQNSGKTDTAMSSSCQFMQNINPIIPATTSVLATVGISAVTATSCNIPTSLMTRTTRSPVFALVWNESERYCTWR